MPPGTSPASHKRAVFFVDGSNWYHRLKDANVRASEIDIEKVASKLALGREIQQIRYYIPELDRSAGKAYLANSLLINHLRSKPLVCLCLGYIQRSKEENPCAFEMLRYLGSLRDPMPRHVYAHLIALGQRHRMVEIFKEKGVDVALACDMVELAMKDAYDIAYLLSADGDYYPAVKIAQSFSRKVFAAGPVIGKRLRDTCDKAIRLDKGWFLECYL